MATQVKQELNFEGVTCFLKPTVTRHACAFCQEPIEPGENHWQIVFWNEGLAAKIHAPKVHEYCLDNYRTRKKAAPSINGILLQQHRRAGLSFVDGEDGPSLVRDGKTVAQFSIYATIEAIRAEADRIVNEITSGVQFASGLPACFDCGMK